MTGSFVEVVRYLGFEPALSEILSFRPLPIGLLTHGVAREIRTLDALRRRQSTVRRPRQIGRLERTRTAIRALRRRWAAFPRRG
jgi:hypothetical protein